MTLAAMAAKGQSLFLDPPSAAAKEEGMRLLLDAAHGGHADAAHLVAVIAASDPLLEDNWVFSLAYLGRAAKAGHKLAQRQLAFLAGEAALERRIADGEELAPETWHRLHDAIDLPAWIAPKPQQVLSEAPFIAVAEGLASPAECDWIIARARPRLEPAKVYDPKGGGQTLLARSNSEMRFPVAEQDVVLCFLRQRIAALTGLAVPGMEPPAILHYAPGQEFRPHYDFLDPDVAAYAGEIARIGQRLATVLVYLNEEYGGGETEFVKLGRRFRGKRGDALIFRNADAAGAPDRATLHAGLPPTRGEKFLLSQWLRAGSLG